MRPLHPVFALFFLALSACPGTPTEPSFEAREGLKPPALPSAFQGVVLDDASGEKLSGATISFLHDPCPGGDCSEYVSWVTQQVSIHAVTDTQGFFRFELGLFCIHDPLISFEVSAPGYETLRISDAPSTGTPSMCFGGLQTLTFRLERVEG